MAKKVKNESSFEYLMDGHEESAVARWSECLQASPIEVLAACEDAVERAETTAEAEALYTRGRAQCVALLQDFCETLSKNAAKIPTPKSIFVGDAERKPAYAAICRMLGETETFKRMLGALTMELMAIESILSRRKRAHNEAARILSDVGAATRRVTVTNSFFSAHATLRARLNAENENALRIAERAAALEGKLNAFYADVLPNFCTRAEKAADMPHDGAACNPMALIRLCGELREATEGLARRLEKQ